MVCLCKMFLLLFVCIFCLVITDSLKMYATVNKTSGDIVYLPNENNSTVWPGMI